MLTNMYTNTYKRNHAPDRVKELSAMIDVHHDQFLAATTFDQKADALRLMRGNLIIRTELIELCS